MKKFYNWNYYYKIAQAVYWYITKGYDYLKVGAWSQEEQSLTNVQLDKSTELKEMSFTEEEILKHPPSDGTLSEKIIKHSKASPVLALKKK